MKHIVVGTLAAMFTLAGSLSASEHLVEISARAGGNHAFPTSLPNGYESTSG